MDGLTEWDADTVNEDTTWVALIIRRALERLSDEERYLLERRFWDMATEREIAKELGISQPAVGRIAAPGCARGGRRARSRPHPQRESIRRNAVWANPIP